MAQGFNKLCDDNGESLGVTGASAYGRKSQAMD